MRSIKRSKRITVFKSRNVHGVQVYTVLEIVNSLKWAPDEDLLQSDVEAMIDRDPTWTVIIRCPPKGEV